MPTLKSASGKVTKSSGLKGVLETYSAPELKKMIRAANITGYSRLKKAELITLMSRPEHRHNFDSVGFKQERKPKQDTKEAKTKAKAMRELKRKTLFEGEIPSKEKKLSRK